MLKTLLRRLAFASEDLEPKALPEYERRQLHVAVALLLHEAARVDLDASVKEMQPSKRWGRFLIYLPKNRKGC